MATRNKAQIITAADVQWSDAQKFDGLLLLGIALPTNYSEVYVEDSERRYRVPLWSPIPIRNGIVNTAARVWFTSALTPPNCKYSAYWYDQNHRLLVSADPALFTVDADPHTITPPTLTVPTAATGSPTPEATPAGPGQLIIGPGTIPTEETPGGAIDGSNPNFTLSKTPLFLILKKNGIVLTESIGYTKSGATIAFQAGYIPQTGDNIRAILW